VAKGLDLMFPMDNFLEDLYLILQLLQNFNSTGNRIALPISVLIDITLTSLSLVVFVFVFVFIFIFIFIFGFLLADIYVVLVMFLGFITGIR
jgi:hypothetical protein